MDQPGCASRRAPSHSREPQCQQRSSAQSRALAVIQSRRYNLGCSNTNKPCVNRKKGPHLKSRGTLSNVIHTLRRKRSCGAAGNVHIDETSWRVGSWSHQIFVFVKRRSFCSCHRFSCEPKSAQVQHAPIGNHGSAETPKKKVMQLGPLSKCIQKNFQEKKSLSCPLQEAGKRLAGHSTKKNKAHTNICKCLKMGNYTFTKIYLYTGCFV